LASGGVLAGFLLWADLEHMCAFVCMLQDDFYILGGQHSHMILTETSNSVLDSKVWEAVVPQAALSWQRVLVANWLSSSGADWARWIKQHNSGELCWEALTLSVAGTQQRARCLVSLATCVIVLGAAGCPEGRCLPCCK
jgi:hypothetical protein